MLMLPAIDLMDGGCVRLAQGQFDRRTDYAADPAEAVAAFAAAGAREVHVVDLDGARAGRPVQHGLFAAMAAAGAALQVAGGFRTLDQVRAALDGGAARVVIGSLALADPDAFAAILDAAGPAHITLALDVMLEDGEPMVAVHGWQRGSGRTLDSVLGDFPTVQHLLVTDIARDGMMAGPNVALMARIVERWPDIELQASGGVAGLDDLDTLRGAGAARAIVGKAIWEGRFDVAEGLARARG